MSYTTTYDEHSDVLYVLEDWCMVRRSVVGTEDGYLVINQDTGGRVVGLQILFVSDMTGDAWRVHPDKILIPSELHSEVESWLVNREKTLA